MKNGEPFADTLSALRRQNGLSQTELARLLSVNQASISRWEKGVGTPTIAILRKLSEIFDIDPNNLISGAPDLPAPAFEDAGSEPVVMLVEDVRILMRNSLNMLNVTLRNASCHGFQRASEALAFARMQEHDVDIAFLDIELFDSDGVTLANQLRSLFPNINIIYLTSHPEYALDAYGTFCSGYLLKPLTPKKIQEQIAHLRYPVRGLIS